MPVVSWSRGGNLGEVQAALPTEEDGLGRRELSVKQPAEVDHRNQHDARVRRDRVPGGGGPTAHILPVARLELHSACLGSTQRHTGAQAYV